MPTSAFTIYTTNSLVESSYRNIYKQDYFGLGKIIVTSNTPGFTISC